MFAPKYQPSTQKGLFHKDVVNHIRKWLKNIDDSLEYKKSVQKLLVLYGPIGCGKSTTLDILLKGYNVRMINPSDLRTLEHTNDIVESIPNFQDVTISNIGKKHKNNILVIDNAEPTDKNMTNFLEILYNKKSINIPVIIMTTNTRLPSLFHGFGDVQSLEMKKPSLLELTKMSQEINANEQLELDPLEIKQLVQLSQFDIRQLLFLLEQKKYSCESFSTFISSVETKHTDIDLIDKLSYVFDASNSFDFQYIDHISLSEPLSISGGIFQNYSNNLADIKQAAEIADSISQSNLMQSHMFNDQEWSLYDVYSCISCVIPCYHIKKQKSTIPSSSCTLIGFKDISYNFINSFEEVKRTMLTSYAAHKQFPSSNYDINDYFVLAKILLCNIGHLNYYFDSNKKGKNTSKQEKFDLCRNITDPSVLSYWNNLVSHIYYNNIFEIDVSKLDVKSYTSEELIMKDITRVDLRMLKRFLNIFTMDSSNKALKSNVETALKFKLLQTVINEEKSHHEKNKRDNETKMEDLVEDLDKIWNF
jgi:ABC-type cobalamin/Fe3+-siderophores transport system ATPase subunit